MTRLSSPRSSRPSSSTSRTATTKSAGNGAAVFWAANPRLASPNWNAPRLRSWRRKYKTLFHSHPATFQRPVIVPNKCPAQKRRTEISSWKKKSCVWNIFGSIFFYAFQTSWRKKWINFRGVSSDGLTVEQIVSIYPALENFFGCAGKSLVSFPKRSPAFRKIVAPSLFVMTSPVV